MSKEIKSVIHAKNMEIAVISNPTQEDYISLTDIAKYKNAEFPADVVKNWLRIRNTIEFLGLWEQLNNPDFKLVEFDQFKMESGANSFVLSPQKWIKVTNSIGIKSKSGRYGGGTYAHKDIAFEFASWISPEFKLYIIQDYQRLKVDESHVKSLDWSVKRLLSKANYKIHTNAIKGNLIPPEISKRDQGYIYADEADLLNVALFGQTVAQWRSKKPGLKGNIRDYATIEQLLVLSNLESTNAIFIEQGIEQYKRLRELNKIARTQLKTLTDTKSVKSLQALDKNPEFL